MRVLPVVKGYNSKVNKNISGETLFERKSNHNHNTGIIYTGEASVDLAYASLFDNAIAKDLKLMGLI